MFVLGTLVKSQSTAHRWIIFWVLSPIPLVCQFLCQNHVFVCNTAAVNISRGVFRCVSFSRGWPQKVSLWGPGERGCSALLENAYFLLCFWHFTPSGCESLWFSFVFIWFLMRVSILLTNYWSSQAWWLTAVIPATPEVEIGLHFKARVGRKVS
jgi:hypothetical protein